MGYRAVKQKLAIARQLAHRFGKRPKRILPEQAAHPAHHAIRSLMYVMIRHYGFALFREVTSQAPFSVVAVTMRSM